MRRLTQSNRAANDRLHRCRGFDFTFQSGSQVLPRRQRATAFHRFGNISTQMWP